MLCLYGFLGKNIWLPLGLMCLAELSTPQEKCGIISKYLGSQGKHIE